MSLRWNEQNYSCEMGALPGDRGRCFVWELSADVFDIVRSYYLCLFQKESVNAFARL